MPAEYENGPQRWYWAKNMYGRFKLLRQGSRIKDKGSNGDTTKAIFKYVTIRKGSIISFEFRAKHTGTVGCIFKYVDPRTFHI